MAVIAETPKYDVRLVALDDQNPGKSPSAAAWKDAELITRDFGAPWVDGSVQTTRFRAFRTVDSLHFQFKAVDRDIVATSDCKEEEGVELVDRVELFFAPGPIDETATGQKRPYFAFEIDPNNCVLDY